MADPREEAERARQEHARIWNQRWNDSQERIARIAREGEERRQRLEDTRREERERIQAAETRREVRSERPRLQPLVDSPKRGGDDLYQRFAWARYGPGRERDK